MTVRKAFMINFRRLLVEKDYSMKRFSYEHGFDYSAVSSWANGKACPKLDTAFRIASALGVTVDDLLKGAEQ